MHVVKFVFIFIAYLDPLVEKLERFTKLHIKSQVYLIRSPDSKGHVEVLPPYYTASIVNL